MTESHTMPRHALILFKDPSALSMRELLKSFSTLKRVNDHLWHYTDGGDAPEKDYGGNHRFMWGLYNTIDKQYDAYMDELEKRTGIDRDRTWYEYGNRHWTDDNYADFTWLKCRLKSTEHAEHILQRAGYIAKSRLYTHKYNWHFAGHDLLTSIAS